MEVVVLVVVEGIKAKWGRNRSPRHLQLHGQIRARGLTQLPRRFLSL